MRVIRPTSNLLSTARYLNPYFPTEVAYWYNLLCPVSEIDMRVAFAQMAKETNWWKFTGIARPEWNNPAGLGVTGAPDVGNRFHSIEQGVRAHLGHLLWYFGEHDSDFCGFDQRHFGEHKHLPNDIKNLDGRWAVPGVGYGESIERIVSQWL